MHCAEDQSINHSLCLTVQGHHPMSPAHRDPQMAQVALLAELYKTVGTLPLGIHTLGALLAGRPPVALATEHVQELVDQKVCADVTLWGKRSAKWAEVAIRHLLVVIVILRSCNSLS